MEPQAEEKLEEEPPEEVRLRPGALLGSLWWYEATKGGRRWGSEIRDGNLLRVGDGGGHERGDAPSRSGSIAVTSVNASVVGTICLSAP